MESQPQPEAPMPGTVLILTPNDELRRQLCDFVGTSGFAVLATSTSREALEFAGQRGREIDLILADQSDESGRTLVQALARSLRMKALLISGDPEYVNRAILPEPWLEFIEKPFAWRDLQAKIDGLLAACAL